jgi:hypothetical protein
MANGGGNFGGDGSVVWEVSTNKDHNPHPRKKVEQPHGNHGKTNAGVDDDMGQYFVILLALPDGITPDRFIRDSIDTHGNGVKIRLKITGRSKQIEIHWSPEFDGTTEGPPIATA